LIVSSFLSFFHSPNGLDFIFPLVVHSVQGGSVARGISGSAKQEDLARTAEALALYEEAAAVRLDLFGELDPETLEVQVHVGETTMALGRYEPGLPFPCFP
jgi:hypothetical protein